MSEWIKSPLPDVPADKWTAFVRAVGAPECAHVETPTGHLGAFLLSPSRLGELGLMTGVRKEVGTDGRLRWAGSFKAPQTKQGFLASPNAQYRAFAQSTAAYAKGFRLPIVTIDGRPLTLSGALGVMHRAGRAALFQWLRSAEDRNHHPFTTSTFHATNGGF